MDHHSILLIATVLSWIAVIAGLYQRVFAMPKWFASPPASFELIRRQSKKARIFWIPLSILYIFSLVIAWFLNDHSQDARIHIIGAIICFALTGILSALYFVPEILSFIKIPTDAPQTPQLLKRIKRWLRWTTGRDILQILSALFVTIAYRHA
jgi:hypothetical protein